MKKAIELFYLKGNHYFDSGTIMSCLYTVNGRYRYDWGFVQVALDEGTPINIRPATSEEMKWANKKLTEIKKDLDAEKKRRVKTS